MKTRFIGHLVAVLLICGAAHGQGLVTYVSQIPLTATSWTKTLQLPSFDSTQGTLTQVLLTFSDETQQQFVAENTGATGGSYNFTSTASISLSKVGGPTLLAATPIVFQKSGALPGFDGTLDFAGTSGFTTPLNVTDASGTALDPNLSSYLGTGLISFTVSTTGVSTLVGPGNFADGALTSAKAQIAVQYSYSPIPEPSTYAAILGLAVLGYVTIRRRTSVNLD